MPKKIFFLTSFAVFAQLFCAAEEEAHLKKQACQLFSRLVGGKIDNTKAHEQCLFMKSRIRSVLPRLGPQRLEQSNIDHLVALAESHTQEMEECQKLYTILNLLEQDLETIRSE